MSQQGELQKEIVAEKEKASPPRMIQVIGLNDNYTDMLFVVEALTGIFNRNKEQAVTIMLEIHEKGRGVCGTYTKDIAEMKGEKAVAEARKRGFPFQIIYEPAPPSA